MAFDVQSSSVLEESGWSAVAATVMKRSTIMGMMHRQSVSAGREEELLMDEWHLLRLTPECIGMGVPGGV